ncbi:hypothetical protein Bca52824_095187 [Brassica carinata]|uniref:Uncharacterized protein n=1 Tax=Brassica carinata TaxID=52824 RepID=A0A8X7P315_BRACI|nr:hypothetical protein Bca52824_095187 [Brassica carinata]
MGNTSSNSSSGVVKILAPFTGTLDVFSKPIKTSQIVSQNSGQFITDSTLLQVGHRVTAVSPDEFLRPRRHLYLLLPTDMLYSVLTHEELALISEKAHRDHDGVEIRETLEEKVLYESKYGSWRPGLETIVES